MSVSDLALFLEHSMKGIDSTMRARNDSTQKIQELSKPNLATFSIQLTMKLCVLSLEEEETAVCVKLN